MTSGAQTRQARENLEAIFRHYQLPLIPVIARFEDRCLWKPSEEWLARLHDLFLGAKFRSWAWFQNHGVMATSSLRENVPRYSMQIIVHGVGGAESDLVIEADIDQYNPDFGAYYAARHLLHDVWGGRADPLRVRQGLLDRGVKVPLVLEKEAA